MTTEKTKKQNTEYSIDFLYNFSNNIYAEQNKEDILKNIKPESVSFFSVAEEKALGTPNGVVIAAEVGNDVKWYTFTLADDNRDDLKAVWPSLETFSPEKDGFGLEEGWNHVDLGMGNHLMVRDRYKDAFQNEIERLKPEHPGIIFAIWKAVAQVVMTKDSGKSMYMKNIENAIENIMLFSGKDNFEAYIPHAIEAFHHAINSSETVVVPVALPQEAVNMLNPDRIHEGDVMTLKHPLKLEMLTIRLSDTENAAAAFTSRDELAKGDTVSSVESDFEDFLKGALKNPEISGVILNPWSTGFVMTKDLIKLICENDAENQNSDEDSNEKLN